MRESSSLVLLLSTLVLALAISAILVFNARKENVEPKCLLVGPQGSGKTLIWSRLVLGDKVETVASLKSNVGRLDTTTIVDTPGHARLRTGALNADLVSSKQVAFVVEGIRSLSSLAISETGAHLHLILSQILALNRPKNLVIVINVKRNNSNELSVTDKSKIILRAQQSLGREMLKRRTRNALGSKLEGLEEVTPASQPGFFSRREAQLLSDEQDILATFGDDVLARIGAENATDFPWQALENDPLFNLTWIVATAQNDFLDFRRLFM